MILCFYSQKVSFENFAFGLHKFFLLAFFGEKKVFLEVKKNYFSNFFNLSFNLQKTKEDLSL